MLLFTQKISRRIYKKTGIKGYHWVMRWNLVLCSFFLLKKNHDHALLQNFKIKNYLK